MAETYKKILLLVPSAYSRKVLGDIISFVDFYRDDFEIFIPVRMPGRPGICDPSGTPDSPGVPDPPGIVQSPGVPDPSGNIKSPGVPDPPGNIKSPGVPDPPGIVQSPAANPIWMEEGDGFRFIDADSDYANYLKYMADYVIDAGSLNLKWKISPSQNWVSVWHGIPCKKMFVDLDAKHLEEAAAYGLAYDQMISMSPWYTKVFLRGAMEYPGKILALGCAKADALFRRDPDILEEIRRRYHIPAGKKILLYAPTFREKGDFALPFSAGRLKAALGRDWVILVKLHYLSALAGPESERAEVVDCSDYPQVIDLMHLSDLMISDYSSLLLDYALLDKPMVLYQYDRDSYFRNRNVYFDFEDYLPPGAVVTEEDGLAEAVSDMAPHAPDYGRLKEVFYPVEDGHSTERIVGALNFDASPRRSRDLIFLINDLNEIGGVHTFVVNMAGYFKKKYGARTILMGRSEYPRTSGEVHHFASEAIDIKLSYTRNAAACRSILSETSGYVISIQFSAHKHFQRWLTGKDVVLMFHGDTGDLIDRTLYKTNLDNLNRKHLYNYKQVLFLTEGNLEKVRPHLAADVKKKAGWMPNSIHAFVHPCRKPEENIFAYVGRLDEDKNPFSLLDLAAVIKKRGLDYQIRIYGDGKLRNQLESRIRKEKLEQILQLQGYESDHDIIYNGCKALLMLSRSEGFPLVILEANSYGKPAVIFDSFTAARDIVADGETGFLVPPENYEGFVEKMGLVNGLTPHRISDFIWQFDNERIFPRWEALLTGLEDMEPMAQKPPQAKSSKRKVRSRITQALSAGKEGYLNYMKKSSARENILLRQYESRSLAALRKRNQNPLISVVVPCYNSRATLPMTLRSLAKQRYRNLEILVIDDGSKDPIEDLVKAARDSRIRYFRKENEGLGLTRNFGIDQAKGKYVFFLDSDDELFPGALANLVRYAETQKLAVVAGQTVRRYLATGEEEIWFPKIYEKTRINTIQTRNRLVTDTLATNKMYARDFLLKNNFRFRKGLYEDLAFSAKTCCTAEKIGILSRKIYIWNIRGENTSISNQKTADNFAARLLSMDDQEQYILPRQKQDWMAFFFSHALIIYLREYHSYSDADKRKVFALARGHFMKYRDYYNPDLIWWKARRLLAMAMDADDFPWFDRICRLCFGPGSGEPESETKIVSEFDDCASEPGEHSEPGRTDKKGGSDV